METSNWISIIALIISIPAAFFAYKSAKASEKSSKAAELANKHAVETFEYQKHRDMLNLIKYECTRHKSRTRESIVVDILKVYDYDEVFKGDSKLLLKAQAEAGCHEFSLTHINKALIELQLTSK